MDKQIFEVVTTSTNQEIVFERNIIRIPFNTDNERDRKLYEILINLQNKVETLEKEGSQFEFLSLTEKQATEKIVKYLKEKKIQGHGRIEIFDISCNLKIPSEQVENILEKLEKEGVVNSIE